MNHITKTIVIAVIVGVVGFVGGMQYQKHTTSSTVAARTGVFAGRGGRAGGFGAGSGAGFTSGQILAKDAQSVTVQLQSGGSKIIFLSASTTVMKASVGTVDDLTVGETITATGSTNTDGSITAQSIQLRPTQMKQ